MPYLDQKIAVQKHEVLRHFRWNLDSFGLKLCAAQARVRLVVAAMRIHAHSQRHYHLMYGRTAVHVQEHIVSATECACQGMQP